MIEEELKKLVDLEIQWLRYYSTRESKNNLDDKSNIYKDLVPIGWTKRNMKLDSRCVPCIITSDELILENINIDKLKKDNNLRGENRYSPVEAYMKIYPNEKLNILNRIKK